MNKKTYIINCDCLEVMKTMQDNSIDFIVTDPPYGLHFMGKDWDKFNKKNFDENGKHKHLENSSIDGRTCDVRKIASANSHAGSYDEKRNDEFQEFMLKVGIEMLRILKPGGHVAMFGAPRRHHRQMSGLEDAGFEIRDCIAWIFGQGFPKSHNFGRNIDKQWNGYGTALKPAYEPIIIAMKPLDGTFAHNAEKWGVGGINIDDCRIGNTRQVPASHSQNKSGIGQIGLGKPNIEELNPNKGRWPANLILDEESGQQLDEMAGVFKSGSGKQVRSWHKPSENNCMSGPNCGHETLSNYGDSGGVSRFFYCAKASSKERNAGAEKNTHPTVKPLSLMKYLIRLLAPPGNPVCLDPFAGSGSTLVAAKELGIECIGIEKESEYAEIATRRVDSSQPCLF